jgi:hypothetical protein
MSFGVQAREPFPGMSFGFINQYTPDQVGAIYEAPSTLVAQMAPLFADPSGFISGVTMRTPFARNLTEFWDRPENIVPNVPQRGIGLEGYLVTRITQTVDYITWTMSGATLSGNAQQTVRLYGEVVPEPAAQPMLVIVCCLLVGRVCQQRK